jgi:TATA-binding protein-associated factor Taf7
MFKQHVNNDVAGVFEIEDKSKVYSNREQKVYLDYEGDKRAEKRSCDCESGECDNHGDKNKPSLKLLNNRVNKLEYELKQANKKLDDIGNMVGALSNVILDSVERG